MPAPQPLLPANLAGAGSPTTDLTVITGPRGVGKTTWCTALVAQARAADLSVGGLLSPARFEAGHKIGIRLVALHTGEERLLGSREALPGFSQQVGCWHFDPAALQWANAALQALPPVDVTVIDELGPLELEQGAGFTAALDLLDASRYRAAWVVIRPELLAAAQARWPGARVLELPGGTL